MSLSSLNAPKVLALFKGRGSQSNKGSCIERQAFSALKSAPGGRKLSWRQKLAMNSLWLTIECFALALRGAYLWLKHRDRLRRWVPSNDPKKWTGHGINAWELRPRVDNVRRDSLAARSVAKR